jgi:hypothetical protein
VTTLLKGHGIDLDHNRFLILQGEVESIAMMKPKAQAPGEEGAWAAGALGAVLGAAETAAT